MRANSPSSEPIALVNDWQVGQCQSVWTLTSVEQAYFPGEASAMPDRVNYQFINGWVATGDLPCRQALRAIIGNRTIGLPDRPFEQIYLGAETHKVDLSDFCHRPTLKSAFARCQITTCDDQELQFEIETCGGVHIWIDDDPVHQFEPFERNSPRQSIFSAQVQAGNHLLTVRFEDLHERDTQFGFALTLLKGKDVKTAISASTDAHRLAEARELLEGLRFGAVFHNSPQALLTSDHLPEEPVRLICSTLPGQTGELSRACPELALTLPVGCPVLTFETDIDGIRISRSIGTTVMPAAALLNGANLSERKASFLTRQDEVDHIEACLHALSEQRWNAKVEQELVDAIQRVEERWDCADFRMMSLLWIWARFRDAMPGELADRLHQAILGFRYWMDEPGNDVMWFWSENHVLCFHVAQHLAGQMLPSAVFSNSGKLGHKHDVMGRKRLHKWFDAIDQNGLAEWNSAAYYPVNYRGLLALFELTEDARLRQRAKHLLDQISAMVALHQSGGVAAGSQGRIYEKELLAGPMTELGTIASVLYGGHCIPGKGAAAILVALSDYEPPAQLVDLAAPTPGATIEACYAQGLETANIELFKDAHVQLSCVTHHKPSERGHQQHVAEIQFAAHPLARIWCNHPGDLKIWGAARPSYWAGNGRLPDVARKGSMARLHYQLRPGDIPFVHAFIPQQLLDEVETEGQWIFFRSGAGYGAFWGSAPLMRLETGQYQTIEWRLHGLTLGCALVAGSESLDGDFASFQQRCHDSAPDWDPVAGCFLDPAEQTTTNFPNVPSREPLVSLCGGPAVRWTDIQGKPNDEA